MKNPTAWPGRALAALATAALLAGCATSPPDAPSAAADMPSAPVPIGISPDLENHHWTLEQALEAGGQTHWPLSAARGGVMLNFDAASQGLSVQGLCNRVLGHYVAQETDSAPQAQTEAASASPGKGGTLQVHPMAATLMACADADLMLLEQRVSRLLPQATGWHITRTTPATLELRFAQGERWQLHGQVKHEALYGQPQRIFLEVAAQTQPCAHPLMPEAQCLQVRTVEYDSQGLKVTEGPWEAFYDSIEGYAHQPGTRHVLRLKRYTRNPAPADASRYVYVLDLVVESETRHPEVTR